MRRLVAVLMLALALGSASVARARLVRLGEASGGERVLLYLPNGKYLKAMSLGHESLLASLVYLWSIQYYSDYRRADRYRFVEHVYGEVITELDPHYIDAYWLGALILTMEKGDLEAGLALLDKGFAANPTAWILPYLAGWEAERFGEHGKAAAYFERAAAAPGAPHQLRRLQAGMVARSGDFRAAIAVWEEVLADPRADDTARGIARRQIRDLQVRFDLERLEQAIAAFSGSRGRLPRTLEELVTAGLVSAVPVDPDGAPYVYDRRAGVVSSPAGRILGGER